MIILDVETTGTDATKHSLLSIGAVNFLNPSERFYGECRIWDGAHIMDEALIINGFTQGQIIDSKKQTEGELTKSFLDWLIKFSNHTLAGHNPSFDVGFLSAAISRASINVGLPKRSIDLHSICYTHMLSKEIVPPLHEGKSALNSEAVSSYVGIPTEPKPHNALNGAIWEAEAFSRLIHNKNLIEQFKEYKIPWI